MPDNTAQPPSLITKFRSSHQLPEAFAAVATDYYLPLAQLLVATASSANVPLVGINGGQGTGKSTLAEFLRLACADLGGLNVVAFSIDDFYLTRAERLILGKTIHPLLQIRGLPGTHDVELLYRCIREIRSAGVNDTVRVPRFDKANDDRFPDDQWLKVLGPVDLIILEGWCVGSRSQEPQALLTPVNDLEKHEDAEGICRAYANSQLGGQYDSLFAELDVLIFLAAPSVEAIVRWRNEQEQKLAFMVEHQGQHLMSRTEIRRFVQLFERLTLHNLATLPEVADVVLNLNESHSVVSMGTT